MSGSRPSAGQWLRYAFGGRLPAGLREWARHDLVDADWVWRHLLRIFLQVAVPAVIVALLPVPAEVRVFGSLLILLGGMMVGGAYSTELRDRRLRQHGFTPPTSDDGPMIPPPRSR